MFSGFRCRGERAGVSDAPVDDVVFVQVLQRQDKLRDVKPRPLLREPGLALQVPEQFAAALEIGDEVEVRVRLEAELEPDEERRLERPLQDLALADRMCHLLLGDDLLFRQDLHGVYPLGVPLADLEHLAERAPADELEKFEIAWGQRAFGLVHPGQRDGCGSELASGYLELLVGDLHSHFSTDNLILEGTEPGGFKRNL